MTLGSRTLCCDSEMTTSSGSLRIKCSCGLMWNVSASTNQRAPLFLPSFYFVFRGFSCRHATLARVTFHSILFRFFFTDIYVGVEYFTESG